MMLGGIGGRMTEDEMAGWHHRLDGCEFEPLFMGFSRQVYWSGLPCCLPGDLPRDLCLLCLLH